MRDMKVKMSWEKDKTEVRLREKCQDRINGQKSNKESGRVDMMKQ